MDTQQQQPNNQPTITDEFIIKVKLLTNEVYEFAINPETTKVSELKQMILEKINVPVDKQRIVFGGKQLLDDNKVTDYVKQSGLTVHLIAKMGTQENNLTNQNGTTNSQTTPQQTNNQQSATQNPEPNLSNPFGNLLRGMGLGGPISGPTGTTMTFTNVGDIGQSLGGILGSLGIRIPPSPANTNMQSLPTQPRAPTTQANIHNNPFQTPPSHTNRGAQQPNQATSSFSTNVPQQQATQQAQTTSNQPFNVSNQPILALNQTISSLNIPAEPVLDNYHMSLREQTAQYLRRLQHQYMRMIPQLNRSVQLLSEGRVTHLGQVLKLFEAIGAANRHAEEAIRRLMNMPVNQPQQQVSQTQQQQYPNLQLQGVQISVQNGEGLGHLIQNQGLNANVQATIIIEDNVIDSQIDEEPTVQTGNQTQSTQQNQRVFNQTFNLGNGGLGNLLSTLTRPTTQSTSSQQPPMMGGLNLGGLMSMFGGALGMNQPPATQVNQQQSSQTSSTQHQQSQQQTQTGHVHGPGCNHSHQPERQHQSNQQPQSSQQPQQFPPFDLANLASMASTIFRPQSQQPNQQPNQQANQQAQNPMSGLMGIFNSLQQSGGIGQLMNMSLGQTLQQGGNQPTIYSSILRSFTGTDFISCMNSKNFEFLDRKYENVRENFLHAISIAGSQEELCEKIAEDATSLLIPKNNVRNYEGCSQAVRKILVKHVSELVRVTMDRSDSKYSQKVTQSLKLALCQSIQRITSQIDQSTLANQQSAANLVFQNLKVNAIRSMEAFIPGLSGILYGFIERDLIRVYHQYKQERKRKQQRSVEQVASQEQLLKQIETQSKKDIEYLKSFKHSKYYGQGNQ